jgi:hypothetical protein
MSILADPKCGGSTYGPVSDAIVCYKFLNALGTYPCRVPDGQRSAILAYSGLVRVQGFGIGQNSYWYVQSRLTYQVKSLTVRLHSSDVALAVLYTIDHCTRPQQDVAGESCALTKQETSTNLLSGYAVANGNGDYTIGVGIM